MGGTLRSTLAALLMVLAFGMPLAAQLPANGGGVTGEGSATIERAPDVLRMQVIVAATGKNAKDALASLRAQEKGAREKLAGLGASGDSVKLGEVRVAQPGGGAAAQQRAELEALIRARTGRGAAPAKPPDDAKATPPVNVSATLTAEWTLKAAAGDERIAEAAELQAKARGAGVVAPPAPAELTPEEQEAAEEAAAMAETDVDVNGVAAPGQPVFVFVSRISEQERSKATSEAFAGARADAARLATAAGARLGPLRHLSGSSAAGAEGSDYAELQASYYAGGMNQLQVSALQPRPGAADAEAIGPQPAKVSYRVTVSATFALESR